MAVVIKIGGARAVDPAGALTDVASLRSEGTDVAVVHGGSTAVDETLEQLGMSPEYVETPSGVVGRFTDEATMDVFKMVFGGLNTDLVHGLQVAGVDAVGFNGVDGKLLTGPRKDAIRVVEDEKKKIRRGDYSGTIQSVNDELLRLMLSEGFTPVIGPPMLADDGSVVNTDADRASAAVAGALGATLVSLTDVTGVYRDPSDESTLISVVETPDGFRSLQAAAEGFMRRKVMAAEEALQAGADRVIISSANTDSPVQAGLNGAGTHISREAIQ